jgi:hypothetical protein
MGCMVILQEYITHLYTKCSLYWKIISDLNFTAYSDSILPQIRQYCKNEIFLCSEFNVHGSVQCKNILIYIQQDATLHWIFYLETALHVSGGTTTHHQERKQLCLQRTPPTAHSNQFQLFHLSGRQQ